MNIAKKLRKQTDFYYGLWTQSDEVKVILEQCLKMIEEAVYEIQIESISSRAFYDLYEMGFGIYKKDNMICVSWKERCWKAANSYEELSYV